MPLLLFLIIFPLTAALAALFVRREALRNALVKSSSLLVLACTIALLSGSHGWDTQLFKAHSHSATAAILCLEFVLAGYLLYAGIRYRRPLTVILTALQGMVLVWLEFFSKGNASTGFNLFLDKLSLMMALIVGIIGGLSCLYSVGYMKDFHENTHREIKDSRGFFFFAVFIFLSSMFGLVFSNNLSWLYFFWEVTTFCSFLLIGYKRTAEARANAFWALELNLLGGLAFLLAVAYLRLQCGITEVVQVMSAGKMYVMLPMALILLAGLIKSAQLPFSSWLTGAMVAPVPVSALLHSSTMVKAGIYIMLRLATALENTFVGYVLALVGAVTFVACALIAISQVHAKKALAYSTASNLGLIVLCAGVGTYEAMWAAMLLVMFHAAAKSLLFLCVGTLEQRIKSMDIEEMSGLVVRMPRVSVMMQIGMAGMFLAPFGMLIGKWTALKAMVDYNPVLALFVVFGSSVTVLFWVKWMGKLITVERQHDNLESSIAASEWLSLSVLSALTSGICLFFPLICSVFVEPYLMEVYGSSVYLGRDNIIIMALMLGMIMLLPLSFIKYGRRVKVVDAYLGGANAETPTAFLGSAGMVRNMAMKNYYLHGYFGEDKIYRAASLICLVLVIAMIGVSWL